MLLLVLMAFRACIGLPTLWPLLPMSAWLVRAVAYLPLCIPFLCSVTHSIAFFCCTDGRIKRSGEQCNFYIYYEVDHDEVPTALREP